ncbi:MAG TPA: hypothetical protein VM870_06555, partial [Pyrinomonadaceae bacterium]|nr:hypothetical protein [Pyrinomonadaceae bacterium]
CPACARIAQINAADAANGGITWSGHPDVGLLRPAARFIVAAQIRELDREANFRPYEGAARFFIIEDADQMNETAANALLKTLEEPPATTHLILLTSRAASLLPTIRSRCQLVRFTPLPVAEIENYLKTEAARTVAASDAPLVARLAHGSIGRALALDLKAYRDGRAMMLDVLAALTIKNDRARLLRIGEELNDAKHKDEYEARLGILETLIHDLWSLVLGGPQAAILNEDVREGLNQMAARAASGQLAAWLAGIEAVRGNLVVNINRKIATDALLLSMADNRATAIGA